MLAKVKIASFILFFVYSLTSTINVQAQNITMSLENVTIQQAINKIQRQYGYSFSINADDVNLSKVIVVKLSGQTIKEALNQIFVGQEVDYVINGKVISVIKKDNTALKPVANKKTILPKSRTITGKVLDEEGEPLIGATVFLKGSKNGVITDLDGAFLINTSEFEPVLQVSYLGFDKKEVEVKRDIHTIFIELNKSTVGIDDIVVVGYGTQKKTNLTGSVSTIVMDDLLANRSVASLSAGLTGLASGLSVIQNSGMAGSDNTELMIRGIGTVNNAAPLVVVDDMPDIDISTINMNDVERISILKDAAAAAVYGSRGANGVILITTKSGNKMEAKVSVKISSSIDTPINPYTFMSDYARVMTLYQKRLMTGSYYDAIPYRDGTIDQWLALQNIDPMKYPSTDWWKLIMKNGHSTSYNASISGGNDKTTCYASFGILNKQGLQIHNDYNRFNARFNYSYQVRKNLSMEARFDGNWSNQTLYESTGFGSEILQYAISGISPFDETTGNYGGSMAYGDDVSIINPLAVYDNCINIDNQQNANIKGSVNWTPVKDLSLRTDYTLSYYNELYKSANNSVQAYNFQTNDYIDYWYVPSNQGVTNNTSTGYKTQFIARAEYKKSLGYDKHKIYALALYSEEFWHDRIQNSYRRDNLHSSLSELESTLPNYQETTGNSSEVGLRSLVFRTNYEGYGRYLVELNCRYDGSSMFAEGHKFGFFPSLSLGWRFSEETFIKNSTKGWLSNGKFRLSYGLLGNNSGVSAYEQRVTLTNYNYFIDNRTVMGFVNRKLTNENLSWESSNVFDLGLDLGFFRNKLTVEADYYDRLTFGMIRPSSLSDLLSGTYEVPRKNIGNLRNKGTELTVIWRGNIQKFKYTISANGSYNASRLESWNEYLSPYTSSYYVNMPYGFTFGYKDTGIATNWQDIMNATPQSSRIGDILLEDVNGDGQITTADQVAYTIPTMRPTTDFGLRFQFQYRNFDLGMLLAGSTGRYEYWTNLYNKTNFSGGGYATSWMHWYDTWNVNNRTASMPRIGGAAGSNTDTEYWLEDMTFLRMKNLQAGYNMKTKFVKSMGFSCIRFYFSSENLFTLTAYRGMDPERIGRKSDVYPQIRSYSLGINLDF